MEPTQLRNELLELLRQPFDIASASTLRVRIAEARVDSLQALYEHRARSLVPKDNQWTELDRRTMLEGFSAEKEKDYQLLVALEEILADYIRTR